MNFNIDINAKEFETQFKEIIKKKYESLALGRINEYFSSKNAYPYKDDGVGTLMINTVVDNILLDNKTEEKMKAFIGANFDRILEEALTRAMIHRANALAFNDPSIIAKK